MKKIISVFLIFMLLFSMSACNGKTATAQTEGNAAEVETGEKLPEESYEQNQSGLPPYETKLNEFGFDEGAGIAPTVLYDGDIAAVTATGISYAEDAALLHIEIENRTDADIQFETDFVSANCLMLGYTGFEFIGAGETMTADIGLQYSDLIPGGVTCLAEITIGELKLTTMDDNWDETILGPFTLYTGAFGIVEKTGTGCASILSQENQDMFGYTMLASSDRRIDIAEGVYSSAVFLSEYEYDGTCIVAELHNDTEENVSVSIGKPTVNGISFLMDSRYIIDLAPHCYSVYQVRLGEYGVPDYCFETLGLSPVREVSFQYALELSGQEASESILCSLSVTGADPAETSGDRLVYDKDGIRVHSFGLMPEYEEEGYVGPAALLIVIENNTGNDIDIQDEGFGDMTLNGREIEFYSIFANLPAGTTGAVSYTTFNSLTDEFDISSVEDVKEGTMKLHLFDCNTYEENIIEFSIFMES